MTGSLQPSTLCNMAFIPCDTCAQPAHCGGVWPDDDLHRPGQLRGCFGAKARNVKVYPTGMRYTIREKVMDRDNEAYARLRKDGVQPDTVDGSHRFEAELV